MLQLQSWLPVPLNATFFTVVVFLQAKERQRTPANLGGTGGTPGGLPLTASGGANPADGVSFNFQPPDPGDDTFLWFMHWGARGFGMAAPGN